jgi:glycine cleavage system aminomethyltransferase T/glycine/D-amino acid oxidase-like deaminating enzyme
MSTVPMSTVPPRARAVLVGAGIVGNSLAYHLARLGWRDIVLLDKGPLPNPGGSTGHASNFIFPVDHSKEMTRFTQDSVRQYTELGVFTACGGIEVARTEERMEELRRRMASARSWGEDAELLTPAQVVKLVPYLDESVILGGFYTSGAGVVDSLRAGTLMREKAIELGALTVSAGTEVLGIDVEDGVVRRVRTDRGIIETDVLVVCCGVWSPRIARMAGATIPLVPAVHQMIDVGPVPAFAGTVGEIAFPIVRDMDTGMYERQHGGELEIGSYAHRPILVDPDDIPSNAAAALSPTELPFTQDDFDPQLEHALELMPSVLSDESVGIKYAINGLLSLTPDGLPVLGETPEARNLWCAAAILIKEAPGIARAVAEWMTDGCPEIDPRAADVARFWPHQRTQSFVRERAAEAFNKTYGIVHPAEQSMSARGVRRSPMYAQQVALGAVFTETAGWERPNWYASNAPLLERYGDRVMPRVAEWESRWWSPIINAEHLALRESVGLVDLSAFAVIDVTGPGSREFLQNLCVSQVDVPVGRVIYTSLLDDHGRLRADLTVMRLGADRFRVVTGGATGCSDLQWFSQHLPAGGGVTLTDVTSAWTTIGVWGPRARDLLVAVTSDDVSNEGFPFATCRTVDLGAARVLASRISYVGELGWELHVPMETGGQVWDMLWEAGQQFGVVPVGIGVYATTARLEKCYRAVGAELEADYDLVESGMARPKVKSQPFVGREAYLAHRGQEPVALLCTLTVDDPTSASGVARYPLGGEPVLTRDGAPLVDPKGRRSYVTTAGSGPSLGRHLLMTYLPREHAEIGTGLAVEYMGERYPVTVAGVGATPVFDPDNARIRA